MEVVVEFEYEALHEDELTLRPGDIIKNVRCIEEDGWMEGDLNGKHGLFPDNFVKEVKKEAKEAKHEPKEEPQQPVKRDKSSGTVANLVQRMSTIGLPTGGFQPRPSAAMKKPKKRLCRALYDYQPVNEDELELKVGDIVDVTEEVEEGWWSGVLNNKSGLFPSNFVKEVDPSKDNGDVNDTTAEDADGGVDSSQSAAGNGAIVQPKKVQRIGYGNIFKDGSLKSRIRIPNLETEEKKDTPSPSFPSAAKAAFPNMTEVQRGDGDSNTKAKDLCKATFAYESTNEDELSFHEDDIITVISKDTGEPGWWRGEIAGREGVFPDNFVLMLSDSEKEAHLVRGSRKSSLKHDSEEKPKKPPPPSKSIALKPEVPSADKKPHIRPEDKVDKPLPDPKPSKPLAPTPPKKPVPPPGKGRQGVPRRPDKALTPSPNLKHNGEMPSSRPKSDLELSLPPKPKPSGDTGDKDSNLINFDEMSSSSEKLSHLTVNRPKITGRRLPAHFVGGGGQSPNKEVNVEKSFKMDEDDGAKLKPAESRKPSTSTSPSTSFLKPNLESKSGPAAFTLNLDNGDPKLQMEDLRSQMKDLLLSVELFKAQQMKEIADLRREVDEEKLKRVALQMELDKLKMAVHST
ncbi:CD2-associated protein isoform X4 [Nerophis lumbriciformis]|uniref:CD2-associated protein isoform X4 n=1 Tax=Nerophis lumbriciformis TaxID=546530 RepID=UPI002ADFACA7|nr:CD2-associated protein-like isoform X2 [Nerophis lumbriciformis]